MGVKSKKALKKKLKKVASSSSQLSHRKEEAAADFLVGFFVTSQFKIFIFDKFIVSYVFICFVC